MSLRILIIEDEPASARNLHFHLTELEPNASLVTTLTSVEKSVQWLSDNPQGYDLIFMDIRLDDGMSFDIFSQVKITQPVIFVTAYDEYALKAFKANGIDYILKPFDVSELEHALDKYRQFSKSSGMQQDVPGMLEMMEKIKTNAGSFKQSFLVHFRNKLIPLSAKEIAWFYTANEIVYAQTYDDRKLVIDFTLEQLQQQLDPAFFFRANRQFIVQRKSITEVEFYFNARLLLKINPPPADKVMISKARVPAFKIWMNS